MQNKVVVEIFGEKYPLKTDADKARVEALAELVNSNMREIASRSKCFSVERIGVLAALQIAEKYFRLQQDYDELLELAAGKRPAQPELKSEE